MILKSNIYIILILFINENYCIDIFNIEIDYHFDQGSDPVMYYADGSGHPGDNSQITIEKIVLTKYYSSDGNEYTCNLDITDSASTKIICEAENEIEKQLEKCN